MMLKDSENLKDSNVKDVGAKELRNRTLEEHSLFVNAMKIQSKIAEYVFKELEDVNAFDKGVEFANSHIEITIGIAVNLIHQRVTILMYPDDDPDAMYEFLRNQVREIYKNIIS